LKTGVLFRPLGQGEKGILRRKGEKGGRILGKREKPEGERDVLRVTRKGKEGGNPREKKKQAGCAKQ